MCGFAGSVGPALVDELSASRALATLSNRGPDAHGEYRGFVGAQPLTLVHARLAIIDLDPRADQPFQADDCVLVYNGEIYNYVELRQNLEAEGHWFHTRSDTEVIVKAYRQYGTACVDHFEGMWALALLDLRSNALWLSRDRFGEKPLYYATWGQNLYFASEIKAMAALAEIRPYVDRNQIKRYLVNGYKSLYKQPGTFHAGVHEFPAASSATITGAEAPSPRRYWALHYQPRPITMNDAVEGVRERLYRTLKLRLRSDVPLAFCLSGGVDSTALVSIAAESLGREVHAFTVVDRDERYNETENVQATVEQIGCSHYVAQTNPSGFFDRLAKLVAYHDAPVATISYYVHSFLSEAIANQGFKVAISGSGADELFTGYYDHYAFWLAEMSDRDDRAELVKQWRQSYGRFVQNPQLQDPLIFASRPEARDHIYLNRSLFNDLLIDPIEEDFTEETYANNPLRNRMLNELSHETVPVLLHEDDLNSMYWSVENRSPFLDAELAEFVYSVPNEHLIHDGFAKWLLRAAVADIAPEKPLRDRRKRGFNASIESVIDRQNPTTLERLLDDGPIFDIVDRSKFEIFLMQDMTDNSFSKFLFSFISAKLFTEIASDGAANWAAT